MSDVELAQSADSEQPSELFSKLYSALSVAMGEHGLLAEPNALVVFMTLLSEVSLKGKPNCANWVHVRVRSLARARAVSDRTIQRALRFLLDHRFLVRNEMDVTLYAIPTRLLSIGKFQASCRPGVLPHPREIISFAKAPKRAPGATRRRKLAAV